MNIIGYYQEFKENEYIMNENEYDNILNCNKYQNRCTMWPNDIWAIMKPLRAIRC